MERKLPEKYSLYDSVYGSEIPCDQYFVILFDVLPSKKITTQSYDPSIINFLKEEGFVEDCSIFCTNRRFEISEQFLFVSTDKQMMFRIHGGTDKSKNNLYNIDVLYNSKLGALESQINIENLKLLERPKKKSNINLVKSDMGHLDTEEYDLFVPDMDLEMNYGVDFVKIHNVIVERLNRNHDKGIILLHGDPGTGKCVLGNTKIQVRNKKTGIISEINIGDLM